LARGILLCDYRKVVEDCGIDRKGIKLSIMHDKEQKLKKDFNPK